MVPPVPLKRNISTDAPCNSSIKYNKKRVKISGERGLVTASVGTSQRVCFLYRCPNHDCDDVLHENQPLVSQFTGVIGKWCLSATCVTCDSKWWICQDCEVSLPTKKRFNQHKNRMHNNPSKISSKNHPDEEYSGLSEFVDGVEEDVTPSINMVESATAPIFLKQIYGRQASVSFFELQHHQEMLGIHSIVDRSILHNTCSTKKDLVLNPLPIAEVDLQFQLARLHLSLPKGLSADLALVCGKIMDKTREEFSDSVVKKYHMKCPVPTTVSAVHASYTRGKNCLLNHLPHAHVIQLDENHTYCPLPMIIADVVGYQSSLDCCWNYIPNNHDPINVKNAFDTKRGIELLNHFQLLHHNAPSLTLIITLWSDDHEPNNTKDNRGSIWSLTVTVASEDGNGYSTQNTYPVSLSIKGISHEVVFDRLAEDLVTLSSSSNFSVYVRNAKGNLKINSLMFSYLADSPEKRGINGIPLGNGIFSSRFGYSCHLKACYTKFFACRSCVSCLESGTLPEDCPDCACWNTLSPLTFFLAPPNYPSEFLDDNNSKLPSIKLSFGSILGSQKLAVSKFVDGSWGTENVLSYLAYQGSNSEQAKAVLLYARREKECVENTCSNTDIPPWKALSSIPVFELEDFVDAPAHLLFLGIVKSVFKLIVAWLSSKECGAPFCRHVFGLLEEVKSLRLSWCMALPFRQGTLGGTVSENMLCLSRLPKWFFQDIHEFASPPVPYEDPITERHLWTIPVLKAWLKARRETGYSSYKVAELRERVYRLMDRSEGAPSIMPPIGGKLSDVINLIIALSDMIRHVMAGVATEARCVRAEVLIKLFLSCVNIVDYDMYCHLAKFLPIWIRKSNFMGLLNIPDMMRSRGPLRLHWELGGRGERVIQDFKKIINTMQGRWAYLAHLKFLQLKALDKIMGIIQDSLDETIIPTDNEHDLVHDTSKYHRYASVKVVKEKIALHLPISVTRHQSGKYFIHIKPKRMSSNHTALEIMPLNFTQRHMDFDYFVFQFGDDSVSFLRTDDPITTFCLILPRLRQPKVFGLITDEWQEMRYDPVGMNCGLEFFQ